jgi:molybdate transport repressor ModE-like protein
MLDVRRMKVLREVAEHGSFSAAAESLSFTQSAVSQQVAALERETGTKLVERGPRGIRLTEAGRTLVKHTDGIVARLQDAEEELEAIAGLRGGRLRFATFPSAGATLVPHAVAGFRQRHPQVELSMVEAESEDSLPLLRRGELDFALVFDYDSVPLREADLELTHLIDDPAELVLPSDHPLASRERVRVQDLADEHWVGSCNVACDHMVRIAAEKAGFDPKIVFSTDDHVASQAFVASGVGVAILPQLCLTAVHPGVVVRPMGRQAPVRRIWAATLADAYCSPACEAMLQILSDVAADYGAEPQLTAVS